MNPEKLLFFAASSRHNVTLAMCAIPLYEIRREHFDNLFKTLERERTQPPLKLSLQGLSDYYLYFLKQTNKDLFILNSLRDCPKTCSIMNLLLH